MIYCQANIENCDAREYLCLCGVMSCSVHGHVDEGDELPEGWNCSNHVNHALSPEDKAHWIAEKGGEPSDADRAYWERRKAADSEPVTGYEFDEDCGEFVQKETGDEIRRVLRDDGTLWVNIGDSYAGGGNGGGDSFAKDGIRTALAGTDKNKATRHGKRGAINGIKPKDLIGIPWMLAFALRADGWYLRQDIIWSKPNPMPESVKDRCTKAHEYVFLLSKSERYFYDIDAIKEDSIAGFNGSSFTSDYDVKTKPGLGAVERIDTGRRNRRSVWNIATEPSREAHFAAFPRALVEPCVLAGSMEDGTVLDPFAGTSTTGMVALRHGRKFIGIEISRKYAEISRRRLAEAERKSIGDLFMPLQENKQDLLFIE